MNRRSIKNNKKKVNKKSHRRVVKKKSIHKKKSQMTDGTKTPIQKSDRVLRSASSRRNNPPSLTTITPSEAD